MVVAPGLGSCGLWALERGLSSVAHGLGSCGPWALERGLSGVARGLGSCGPWALERGLSGVARGLWSIVSAVVAHGLNCSVACGIFLDQGSNPRSLHRQVDSYPLDHLNLLTF